MEFKIPCATFARLYNASLQPHEPDKNRPMFRAIRIEYHQGKIIAVATNGAILACELMGETLEPDAGINITNRLIDQCRIEAEYKSELRISFGGGWALATTSLGYAFPENAHVSGEWPNWREYIPKDITRKWGGGAAFDITTIPRLVASSPGNSIVLPKIVDGLIPTIVNDPDDPNWFGMFLTGKSNNQPLPAADVPSWARLRRNPKE